jgi:hypothetical protein
MSQILRGHDGILFGRAMRENIRNNFSDFSQKLAKLSLPMWDDSHEHKHRSDKMHVRGGHGCSWAVFVRVSLS